MTGKSILNTVFLLAAVWSAPTLLAHGEDKPGPHGGHIRMPASYHSELVPDTSGLGFKVYLSDIQFANPDTNSSELTATAVTDRGLVPLVCEKKAIFFYCSGSILDGTGASEIRLSTKYKDHPRATAVYKLPLKSFP